MPWSWGDSHGSDEQAVRILDIALERDQATAAPVDLVEALAYRAELAVRGDDEAGAREFLARAERVPLSDDERATLAGTLAGLRDLAVGSGDLGQGPVEDLQS
ncbi:hypothetical protein [Kibdelosporangium aridum]|uniref:hypothetical protein n=1 Tax=Kibdelosporangium aridum TaxID=2030 RepID=UPI0035EA48B0